MLRRIFSIGVLGAVITLLATPAFARTAELKDAGATLWVFLAIGATIILLQLIPAGILFLGFVSTATATVYKKPKRAEERVVRPVAESAVAKP